MNGALHESLEHLEERHFGLILEETGYDRDDLEGMSEDDLYDKVYDTMCDIEIAETPLDDSDLSEHCRVASEIVTVMGNAIAEENGYLDEED